MNHSPHSKLIVFLLGAGFNVDAANEAGNPKAVQYPAKYPVVSDLLKLCFNLNSLPPNKSIEDLFQECIKGRKEEPITKFYDILMEADYFITPWLFMDERYRDNVYMRFLNDFPMSPLITFNYDSLFAISYICIISWNLLL